MDFSETFERTGPVLAVAAPRAMTPSKSTFKFRVTGPSFKVAGDKKGDPFVPTHINGGNLGEPRHEDFEVTILVIDDNPDDISIIRRLLSQYTPQHFKVRATGNLVAGLEMLEEDGADIIMLDYSLPSEDGLSFLRRSPSLSNLPPVIMITGQNDYHLAAEAIRYGASDCINKNGMTSNGLGQSIEQALSKFRHDITLSRYDDNVIQALTETASLIDPTTGGARLAHFAVRLGRGIGISESQIEVLRYGAILHDIGKLGLRNELIRKPSSLTEAEFTEIRLHPLIGERICAPLRLSREVGPIIRHHHERWDGEGYVDGLRGLEIPLLARVISVADAYEAMTADRPYRAALTEATALKRLRAGAGTQWDPDIIAVFLDQASRGLHHTGLETAA